MRFLIFLLFVMSLPFSGSAQFGIVGENGRPMLEMRGNHVMSPTGYYIGNLNNFRFSIGHQMFGYMLDNAVVEANGRVLGYVFDDFIICQTGVTLATINNNVIYDWTGRKIGRSFGMTPNQIGMWYFFLYPFMNTFIWPPLFR